MAPRTSPESGSVVRIVIPDSKTRGWQARRYLGVFREPGKRQILYASRFYADRKYGGSEAAYQKASRWLKEVA